MDLIDRLVVPPRLALIYRSGETIGYNQELNTWARLDVVCSKLLRWLRSGHEKKYLLWYFTESFSWPEDRAKRQIQKAVQWCILRRLLYLDQVPSESKDLASEMVINTVYWICTQACNLSCSYCYQDAKKKRPAELSTTEAIDLINQIVDIKADTLVITGGEPFSRHDILEIAKFSRAHGLKTNVITNGSYINIKNASAVAQTFDLITISLDHAIPEYHDYHRGAGSWMRAVRAVDLLLKAGARVDISSVVSQSGLAELEQLVRIGEDKRIRKHKIVPLLPTGRGKHCQDELAPSELLQLDERINSLRCKLKNSYHSEVNYAEKGVRRDHCGAARSEISVDPEGWVFPCRLLQSPKFKAQNIRHKPLAEIISIKGTLECVRKTSVNLLYPCSMCIIKNYCGGGCRGIHFSYTNDYMKSSPLFCAFLRRNFEVKAWTSCGIVPPHRRSEFLDGANTVTASNDCP